MKLAVVGSTGYTGRRLVKKLRQERIEFTAVGRSENALAQLVGETGSDLRTLVAEISSPSALSWLRDYDTIVSCVGPYDLYGRPLATYAAENGMAYIDVTGEQGFVKWSRDTLHETALQSGATLVHACGFESIFADLLASQLGSNWNAATVFYLTDPPLNSHGTRFTMALAGHAPSFSVRDGVLSETPALSEHDTVSVDGVEYCGYFVGYPDILFFSWRPGVKSARTMVVMDSETAETLREMVLVPLASKASIVERFQGLATKHTHSDSATSRQKALIAVCVMGSNGRTRIGSIVASDPYGMTVDGVIAVVKGLPSKRAAGVLAPSSAIDPAMALERLARLPGYQIVVG
jgi:Saccharopine dehydrogenase NADP binding domain